MKLVLIGFSGTGKSTVGQALASRLGWDFVDTDSLVEREAGKPIHLIFAEDGESAFRRLESRAVRSAVEGERRVISVGGGAVMDPANRQSIQSSTVVLLEATVDTMLRRLQVDAGEPRPMLWARDPRERMEALKAVRDPVYHEFARMIVSTEDVDVDGAVARIIDTLGLVGPHGGEQARGHVHAVAGREGNPRHLTIRAAAGEYRVLLGRGLLDRTGDLLLESGLTGRARLIADETVYAIYGRRLEDALRSRGIEVDSYQFLPGEASKSLETAASIYDWMAETVTERRDVVLALGGGVTGDLAGFVAATYLRGLRLVQLPTSLLAQVDSSVGGKVAIDHPQGKNLIGAFYPPSLVIADIDTLSTMPPRELSASMAEAVKHGVILDSDLFDLIEGNAENLLNLEAGVLRAVIGRSIELKAQVVETDEKETGVRAILNYGHTIGHAVETATGFDRYRHGEAVAIGMVGAAAIAVELGMMSDREATRQRDLLVRLGLPVACPGVSVDRLLVGMRRDKKATEGNLSWVLPETVGRVIVRRDVPLDLVERVLERLTTA